MPEKLSLSLAGAEATMTVDDLHHLFDAPPADPLDGIFGDQSGFDLLLQQLKREKLPREPLRWTIVAPAEQAGPEMQDRVRAAVKACAATRMRALEVDRLLHRRELKQALRVGGLFLVVCLILSAVVDQLSGMPPFVQTLLRESLLIAGWVGLWHPLDLLLYAWWPLRYRRALLTYVAAAEVRLVAR